MMSKVAGVSIPKSKFVVSVLFAKLALRPRPQAGARSTVLPSHSVNHSAPSGPTVIPLGSLAAVGTGYSVNTPVVVMRAILLPFHSVNHNAPSGPAVIPKGWLGDGMGYSVIVPAMVMRPTWLL